jgi:hypothetical protein
MIHHKIRDKLAGKGGIKCNCCGWISKHKKVYGKIIRKRLERFLNRQEVE